MKGLKCTTNNCEFNNRGHCEAGVINIGANAICKTKMKKHFEDIDAEYERMEVAGEFDFSENDDVLIECDSVNCKYNKDHICTANRVDIRDTLMHTKCVTKNVD